MTIPRLRLCWNNWKAIRALFSYLTPKEPITRMPRPFFLRWKRCWIMSVTVWSRKSKKKNWIRNLAKISSLIKRKTKTLRGWLTKNTWKGYEVPFSPSATSLPSFSTPIGWLKQKSSKLWEGSVFLCWGTALLKLKEPTNQIWRQKISKMFWRI